MPIQVNKRNQDARSEVDVEYCRAHNIQIVRRMNGGGAVYHEMGSFCFSAFFRRDLLPHSEEELYRLFAAPVIRTCADYGVAANFQGRNDLAVGERKIYGCAHFSWYHAYVQSGTFLVNMDFDVMALALTPSTLKFAGKTAASIHERVTSLSHEVGREVATGEVMQRFADHFADVLGIRLVPGDLTHEEQALAAELLAVTYSADAWNLGSQLEYQITVADRTNAGVISLSADVEGNTIQNARITGDVLLSRRQELDNLEISLAGCSLQAALTAVQSAPLAADIRNTLLRLLGKLGQEVSGISSIKHKEEES